MDKPTTHAPLPKAKAKVEAPQENMQLPPDIAEGATVPAAQYAQVAEQLNIKQARIEELTAQIAGLEKKLQDQETEFLAQLEQVSPEAIYSSTCVMENANGFRKQLTVRARPGEGWKDFRDREEFGIYRAHWESGWKPAASLYAPRTAPAPQQGAPTARKAAPERAPAAPKQLPGRGSKAPSDWDGKTECFDAVELVVIIGADGDPRFKVKDDKKFKQYGVPIYPEALQEAGFEPGEFEAGTYDLKGYRAYYIENSSGKAYKVVRLTEEE